MAYRLGRCTNDLYCSSASDRDVVQVPVAGAFVCPQCGKGLVPPAPERRRSATPMLLILGGLTTLAGALFAAGGLLSDGPGSKPTQPVAMAVAPPPKAVRVDIPRTAAVSSQPAAPSPVVVPQAMMPPKQPVPVAHAQAVSAIPPAAPPARQALPAPGPAATPVSPPAFPLTLAMTQQPSPDSAVLRAQQEQQARAQQAAAQARTADLARRAEADRQKKLQKLALEVKRKQLLAKQAADDQAKAQQEEAATAALAANQAARDAAARQAADKRAAEARLAAEATRREAARPAGPTRAFSPAAVAGGSPSYPSAYEADARRGRVTVSCLITQSGAPTGCHVVASEGGVGFNNAAIDWLRSGRVRFKPILRNGQPRTEEHSWSMSFEP